MKFLSRLLLALIMSSLLLFSTAYAAGSGSGGDQQGGIVKLAGDIYVNEGNTVEGDVVTVSGNIYINGSVTGSAVSVFGDIIVNGKVLGDAVSVTGKITVGENGKVLGDTVEAVGGSISRKYGSNRYDYRPNININPFARTTHVLFSFFTTLGIFLLAALIYLIMPNKIDEMAASIEPNLGKRLGIGILTIIGSPIAMILLTIVLAITIIGILIIPFAWIAYFIAMFIGVVPVYLYIGRKVSAAISRPVMSSYAAIGAGLLTIWLIRSVASFGGFYTGWISWIISFAVYVIGIGTILDYIFSNRNRNKAYNGYQPYNQYPPQGEGYNPNYQAPNPPATYVPEERESKMKSDEDESSKGEDNQQ